MCSVDRNIIYADSSWQSRLAESCPEWQHPELASNATLIKENTLRRVYRLDTEMDLYFIKEHRPNSCVQRLKQFLRGTPAENELFAAQYAARNNVPTIQIIACAKRTQSQPFRSLSISPAIQSATTLDRAFLACKHRAALGTLIASAATLVAKAHEAAFLHQDSHPGNILVQTPTAGGFTCYFVDLFGARYGTLVSDAAAAANLAALHQWFDNHASLTQKLRFLKAYWIARHREPNDPSFKAFAKAVETASIGHAHALYAKRDRRIRSNNTYFAQLHPAKHTKATVTLRFRNLARILPVALPQLTSQEWNCLLGRELGSSSNPQLLDAADRETFCTQSLWTRVAWALAHSPAYRRYHTAALALNRDVPSVAGVAHIQGTIKSRLTFSTWIILQPDAGQPLLDALRHAAGSSRSRLIDCAARLFARTTRRGLVIHNLDVTRFSAVEVVQQQWQVYWTGIEGAASPGPLPRHTTKWMLAELARKTTRIPEGTRTDRARFLQTLLRNEPNLQPKKLQNEANERHSRPWKSLWRQIDSLVTA